MALMFKLSPYPFIELWLISKWHFHGGQRTKHGRRISGDLAPFSSVCYAWGPQARHLFKQGRSVLQCLRTLLHGDTSANHNVDVVLQFFFSSFRQL